MSFSQKTLSAAVLSALLCSSSYGAGLGKLTVLSALGQPLRAEIELTSVSKEESGVLVAKLASVDAYRQANIDFNPILFTLRFAIEKRDQRQFIRVTSSQPVNEPFVDMLLELGGTNNRLVREYTFLLDPADLRLAQAAPIAIPAPAVVPAQQSTQATAPVVQPAQASSAAATPAPQAVKSPEPEKPAEQKPESAKKVAKATKQTVIEAPRKDEKGPLVFGDYQVKKGDSLAKIAIKYKPEGVSLDQMLVALYRDNPKAFDGKNMNRMRVGQIISIPDAPVAQGIEQKSAHGVVVAQAADFNKYRNKLAAQVTKAEPQKAAESKQSTAGKITAKVEEPKNPVNDAKDKLKLSTSSASANAAGGKATAMAAGAEEKIAKDKALADANLRVKELEKNVSDLQKILEIKTNKDLADKQKQAELAKAETAKTESAKAAAAAVAAAESAKAAAAAATTKPVPAPTPVPAPAAASASAVASVPTPDVASVPAAAKPPAEVKTTKPVVKPPVAPVKPEPSFLDDNAVLLSSLGGVLLLGLGAFGIYSARRKKQNNQFEDSTLTDSSLKANSLFGSTGGQSVDTNNSVFNSNFSPSASQLDTNEVDPVAEADVYIAYGRDAQAEEILKEALRTQPNRNPVRVKLLEIYANRKDLRAFEILATELYSMTKGEGADWAQAATLGLSIDPNNPLYAGGTPTQNAAVESAALSTGSVHPVDELDLSTLMDTSTTDPVVEEPNKFESTSSYFENSVSEIAAAPEIPMDLGQAAESESSTSLDFDLDGLTVPQAQVESPKPAAAPISMDFDLDGLDVPKATTESAAPVAAPMDFDLSGMTMTLNVEKKVAAAEEPMDLDIGDLDFGLPQSSQAATVEIDSDAGTISDDFSGMSIATTGLSDDFIAPHQETKSAEPLNLDLSGISLDLNPSFSSPAEVALDLNVPEPVLDDHHFSNSEMATKMDLAIAYQEIGDKDGARELLDEVIKGGTGEQSEKAKSMLVKLG